MTHRARVHARHFRRLLEGARAVGGASLWSWALATGGCFAALVELGDATWGDAAEWKALCGIPPQAALDRPELETPKGRPS
jgi:hypothetical protein